MISKDVILPLSVVSVLGLMPKGNLTGRSNDEGIHTAINAGDKLPTICLCNFVKICTASKAAKAFISQSESNRTWSVMLPSYW